MENEDKLNSNDSSNQIQTELQKRIEALEDLLAHQQKLILEKDSLLSDYWDTIQRMRLTNRLKRILQLFGVKDAASENYKLANQLITGLTRPSNGVKVSIKISVYNWRVAHTWGDFHFALSLRKELSKLGYQVTIQPFNEWYIQDDTAFDVILVLRGLAKYNFTGKSLRLMWNISHPDQVSINEYKSYHHSFISSLPLTNQLRVHLGDAVSFLPQCTDRDEFRKPKNPIPSTILFVGNSKGFLRPIIRDVLPTPYDLSIYGSDWENFVDRQYIKGKFIARNKLHQYYGGAKVVLNDHWEDMKANGFISNRIFDALASGAFIISDSVEGIAEMFGNAVVTYHSREDLQAKLKLYLENEPERKAVLAACTESMIENHTFTNRALQIEKVIHTQLKMSGRPKGGAPAH